MRALLLEVPEELLAERRRSGADRRDEVWDGVVHMVPPQSTSHGFFADELCNALRPLAAARGWRIGRELGLYGHRKNYRVPDIMLAHPDRVTERGMQGAELVIEVLSPHDESRDKFPFFATVGVREVWLIERATREVEIHQLVEGAYHRVSGTRSPVLGVELRVIDGPQLRISDGDYRADV